MNSIECLDVDYIRSCRTIETLLVSNDSVSLVFFVYNYEGVSYRVFRSHVDLINFFQDESEEDYHFGTEEELDEFLSKIELKE